MDPEQIAAYIQAGSLLISVAGVAVDDVKHMFSAGPALTDDELNAILAGIGEDADRRAALARGDAGETS